MPGNDHVIPGNDRVSLLAVQTPEHVGRDETVGRDISIEATLKVGRDETVGRDISTEATLKVGRDERARA